MPKALHADLRLFSHSNSKARINAVRRVGALGYRSAIPFLARMLRNDEEHVVRYNAARALHEIGERPIGSALVPYRGRLKGALWRARRPRAGMRPEVPHLVDALSDEHGLVRMAAADALGRIGAKSAVPQLINCLIDEYDLARQAAARSLGLLGAVEAKGHIEKLVKDKESGVRGTALRALEKLSQKQ